MIQDIEVSGFRSLMGFKLTLKPGLNVLVGPNGAGKTNIVRFFEFLSDLAVNSLPEAIARGGGAGVLFNRRGVHIESSIYLSVSGSANLKNILPDEKSLYVNYRYTAKICLDSNELFFGAQELHLYTTRKKASQFEIKRTAVAFVFSINDKGEADLDIKRRKSSSIIPELDEWKSMVDFILKPERKKDFTEAPLFAVFQFFTPVIRAIPFDFINSRAYNIDPRKVKETEDIARSPGMDFDGSGFAATIYSIRKQTGLHAFPFLFFGRRKSYKADAASRIAEYCRLMDQQIIDIEAESDPMQNKLLAFAVVGEGENRSRVPMGLVSDGTAKWLALIVAVLTNRSSLSIEEPENFLHPRLQQEIVRIVRSICEDPEAPDRAAIMTTHSETLLNALYAEEVVVTLMTEGVTSCHRAANVKVLSEMINETGFGLGHFYVTGAIE